jgi:hypothetical protein
MKSKTTLPNALPIWQNKYWSIETISDSELAISNGSSICYCYISKDKNKLYFDHVNCPKYISKKALSIAKKHIQSIYN